MAIANARPITNDTFWVLMCTVRVWIKRPSMKTLAICGRTPAKIKMKLTKFASKQKVMATGSTRLSVSVSALLGLIRTKTKRLRMLCARVLWGRVTFLTRVYARAGVHSGLMLI